MRLLRSTIMCTSPGTLSRCHLSVAVTTQSGNRPTIERTLSRVALPSGKRKTS
jgi:hypothetical protein